jgi:hypothetical protein
MRTIQVVTAVLLLLAAAGCGEEQRRAERERSLARASERSRILARADWVYDRELAPPSRGQTQPVEEDRCRVALPDDGLVDVACGQFFLALEPGADQDRVDVLMAHIGGEVLERREIPGWATRLDDPLPYILVAVPIGREPDAIRRALASEGVRFADVRRVRRLRP